MSKTQRKAEKLKFKMAMLTDEYKDFEDQIKLQILEFCEENYLVPRKMGRRWFYKISVKL